MGEEELKGNQSRQQDPKREPIVLSRACADLYEEVASVCQRWDDIGVVVDRREGTGEHGFIVPRNEEPEPVRDLPDT